MNDKDYGYYSKILKQPFDTLEALRTAEAKVKALEQAKDEKKEDAKKVNEAYSNYVAVTQEANKNILKARKAFEDLKDAFVKKYGSYHMTYTSPDGSETREVSEVYSSNVLDTFMDFADLVDKYLSR